jgi:hypothetical protein
MKLLRAVYIKLVWILQNIIVNAMFERNVLVNVLMSGWRMRFAKLLKSYLK